MTGRARPMSNFGSSPKSASPPATSYRLSFCDLRDPPFPPCRIFTIFTPRAVRPIRVRSSISGGQPKPPDCHAPPTLMMHYLVTIHRPADYDPSVEDEAMGQAISALNREMVAAGVRVFVGGLQAPGTARSLRPQPDGTVGVASGPYLPTTEHAGGLWVLAAANLDEALAWGRKAALACRAPVEVRPFHPHPPRPQ